MKGPKGPDILVVLNSTLFPDFRTLDNPSNQCPMKAIQVFSCVQQSWNATQEVQFRSIRPPSVIIH